MESEPDRYELGVNETERRNFTFAVAGKCRMTLLPFGCVSNIVVVVVVCGGGGGVVVFVVVVAGREGFSSRRCRISYLRRSHFPEL
jgi:hypothetical protein